MTAFEEFNLRYPEFLSPPAGQTPVTEEQIEYWLVEAESYLYEPVWGSSYRKACLAWAATMLSAMLRRKMNGPAVGEPGPVSSVSVGGESTSYLGNGRFADATYTEQMLLLYPPYGPEFLALRNAAIAPIHRTNAWSEG